DNFGGLERCSVERDTLRQDGCKHCRVAQWRLENRTEGGAHGCDRGRVLVEIRIGVPEEEALGRAIRLGGNHDLCAILDPGIAANVRRGGAHIDDAEQAVGNRDLDMVLASYEYARM